MSGPADKSRDLHALPDHEVMQACLKGVKERRKTREEAVQAIKSDPGWIPVAVDPEDSLIYFVNVGQRQLDRWQFVYSISALSTGDPSVEYFSVEFGVLQDLQPYWDESKD